MKKYLVFLFVCLLGCGGGSSSSVGPQPLNPTDIPSISDLQTTPDILRLNEGGGTVQVTISINFIDNNGDIATVRYTDSSGEDLTVPLTNLNDTSGSVDFAYNVDTTVSSSIAYNIWLIDAANNESNKLSGSIWVSW